MKVAIVSFYCLDSTMPLAKNLLLKGVEVDLYCVMRQWNQNAFVIDFSKNLQPNGFVNEKTAQQLISKKILNYLSEINTKVFIYPVRRLQKYLLGDLYYSYKLSKSLKKNKYDTIHLIPLAGRFPLFLLYLLKRNKIVVTLHEVTAHESTTNDIEIRKLKWLINNSTPIIFHSNTTKNRFIDFQKKYIKKGDLKNDLEMIRFGLYETYTCFANQLPLDKKDEKSTILFLGRIVPYKGIHFLIDAVKLLQEKYSIHLVVAGMGEPYFDFNGITSYNFINRPLSNEEIVKLIEECDMVVLPYTSASQSGLPMTVYAFNKPIIASNVDGLSEVIDHLKTGILVDNLSGQSFADSIEKLLLEVDLKNQMVENIKKKYTESEFSWSAIANKTISFYQKQLDKSIF